MTGLIHFSFNILKKISQIIEQYVTPCGYFILSEADKIHNVSVNATQIHFCNQKLEKNYSSSEFLDLYLIIFRIFFETSK
ncbi:hypothetical protein BpHYR1_012055 [Brachionus plicatilis]|uniref:Uncharacterized protein n=1 Tax=Brachionus plicatilis TaxID=10195 RepID=A0A3M7SVI2_BRAPC|nr:hypothetical protein BpHYR1_012055 [Brachionus plicatilis]